MLPSLNKVIIIIIIIIIILRYPCLMVGVTDVTDVVKNLFYHIDTTLIRL